MITIALDAMGGDHFPKPEVEGAIQAVKAFPVRVILVGREEVIRKELDRHPGWQSLPIEIENASEHVTMEDSAGKALRTKKDSSIRVASRLVSKGIARGVVSAGNTGAVMAVAKLVQGTLPGVDRPALASAFPTLSGHYAVMLDVGANVDCSAKMLAQFAVMGSAYSRVIFHTKEPRVGLRSIGEEEHKGNVEGRDLYTGKVDVIVCDGFVGNGALKVSEGLVDVIRQSLKESLKASLARQVGAYLAQGAFNDFKKRVDYSEYGGVPLVGLNGLCVIGHGRSNAKAIRNAMRLAKESAEAHLKEKIAP